MKTILASVLIMLATGMYGQQIKFYRTFTKPDWDYADAVIERYDGNYLMAGSSRSQNSTDYDISLILVDPQGNTIWDKYLGQADSMEFAFSLIETSDNNYLVSGRIGMSFPYLSLFDINGELIRDMRYPEGNQCYGAYSVGETPDNNYYFIESGQVSTLYLTNPSGGTIWAKAYDFAYCHAVIQTSDGGFLLTGHIEGNPSATDAVLIKLDSLGDYVLSTKEIEFEEFPQVLSYPVPAKDILHFRMAENNLKIDGIRIFNSSGVEMNVIPVLSGNEVKTGWL